MKIIIQRVKEASVEVNGKFVAQISEGLLCLVGFGQVDNDTCNEDKLKTAAKKLLEMRIFASESGDKNFNYSCLELEKEVLLVPQFTLYANTNKGRRPDFFEALEPAMALELFNKFTKITCEISKAKVACGVFGADMKVRLLNDGPVTICLEF